jgi:hypothetical protein
MANIIMVLVLVGLAVADVMQIFSHSYNSKRKWRIVIVISLFGLIFTQAVLASSSWGESVMVAWGLSLAAGVIGNYVNS